MKFLQGFLTIPVPCGRRIHSIPRPNLKTYGVFLSVFFKPLERLYQFPKRSDILLDIRFFRPGLVLHNIPGMFQRYHPIKK